jgi:FMN phosphatase YigB (HAD superfamily)
MRSRAWRHEARVLERAAALRRGGAARHRLARYFDAVYSIEDARYRGKPALHGFRMLLRKHHLDPHRCAFIDDMLDNLRTAHRLGMSTVWVSALRRRRRSSTCDRFRLDLPRLVFRQASA